jgi:hypothetical protein
MFVDVHWRLHHPLRRSYRPEGSRSSTDLECKSQWLPHVIRDVTEAFDTASDLRMGDIREQRARLLCAPEPIATDDDCVTPRRLYTHRTLVRSSSLNEAQGRTARYKHSTALRSTAATARQVHSAEQLLCSLRVCTDTGSPLHADGQHHVKSVSLEDVDASVHAPHGRDGPRSPISLVCGLDATSDLISQLYYRFSNIVILFMSNVLYFEL